MSINEENSLGQTINQEEVLLIKANQDGSNCIIIHLYAVEHDNRP